MVPKMDILRCISVISLISTLFISVKGSDQVNEKSPIWTWKCVGNKCQKQSYSHDATGSDKIQKELMTLDVCKLTCGDPPGSLWPLPTGTIDISKTLIPIKNELIGVNIILRDKAEMDAETNDLFKKLSAYFNDILSSKTDATFSKNDKQYSLVITATVNSSYKAFNLNTNEGYLLEVEERSSKTLNARITSDTFFGTRHALETLNQLIVADDHSKSLVMPKRVYVTDAPAYSYRGLTLDTSRNYISLGSIKRMLNGMAANKLNIFHWHITDTHSFPFVSKSLPNFSLYGAYSPEKVYTPSDIKDILDYAKVRGIKVVPEFDAPAHVGEGWQWTPAETVVCLNEQPWNQYCVEPPCGQLNPTKDHLYEFILPKLYMDMFEAFEVDNLFHMGGDEVHFQCWNNTNQITSWMTSRDWSTDNEGFLKLWNYFQQRAYQIVEEKIRDKPAPDIILWTSGLTTGPQLEKYLDKEKYIIQIWTTVDDQNVKEILEKGYRVIFSNYDALYLDCGFGGWVNDANNWCSPYKSWQKIYMNDPPELVANLTDTQKQNILGQAAALWTEQADDQTIDSRFWPRAAALAERTWSNPSTSWKLAEYRMLHQRERLVHLGLRAEALEPAWCNQNEGSCPIS